MTSTEPTTLLEKLEELPELKPFPVVATKVMQASNDPGCDLNELIEIIQCDPSIALRLLRVANSSIYGFSGQIKSIDQAVVILGMRNVRDIVVAAAAADVFSSGNSARQAREALWQHSLACASIASVLSSEANVAKEEAFLAGILHDVGKLVFFDLVPNEYETALQGTQCSNIITHEGNAFGINHQEIGGRCSDDWGLPIEINDAITFHHTPKDAEGSHDLVRLISVSDALSHFWQFKGSSSKSENIEEILENSGFWLSPEVLEDIKTQAITEFENIQKACA